MTCIRVINQTRQAVLAEKALVADTAWRRVVGLLCHKQLEPGAGLLIKPCNSIHSIGMKFIFDAIFIDQDGSVVHLIENMKPWRASKMVWKSHQVLELPAGKIAESHTQMADQIVF
jgi:uncharacterized membrane protein (UPF0127 family)